MKTHRSTTHRKPNEGVALILTLLFVVLLTVLVVEFAYEAQVEASYSLNSENEFQVKLAARSAVYKGISVLETDRLQAELADDPQYSPVDSRMSSWALPGEFEPLNDAVMRATITDEFGKININALIDYGTGTKIVREHLREALIYFFEQRATDAGVDADPEALVYSIIDWLDEDDDNDDNGAETDFYESAEIPYPCKNGPMDSIDELLLIRGMTPELFFGVEGLEPPQFPLTEYLTVHGDWLGRINPNTVLIDYEDEWSPVLAAYAEGCIQTQMVDVFDAEGMVVYMLNAQDETGVFQSVEDLAEFVEPSDLATPDAGPDQPRDRRRRGDDPANQDGTQTDVHHDVLRQLFTVHSHVFRIYGDALMDDIMVRNEAYVLRQPQTDNLDLPQGNSAVFDWHPMPAELQVPEEYYRILEWKVIQ